jgi:hypothetical protein
MEELAPGAAKMMVVLHRWMGSVSVGGAQHPIVVVTDGNGTGQLVLSRDVSAVQGLCSKAYRREVRRMKETGQHVLSGDVPRCARTLLESVRKRGVVDEGVSTGGGCARA